MRSANQWFTMFLLLAAQCRPSEPPPTFGGQGASIEEPGAVPLEQGQGELPTGPCAKPAPPAADFTLDDFEDGDHHLFKVFERDGWWFTATDATPGVVEPPRDQFKPALLPEGEAAPENRYAGHFVASGFTDWGVVWGTTLEWRREGVKCPFNASAFTGVRLRAKGTGRVRVNLGTPDTFPKDNGGNCTQGCYDTHGKILDLSPDWTWYTIEFDKLQQGGWGAEARFDEERLLSFNFNVNPEWQPADFWVDDLTWIDGNTPPSDAAPAQPSGAPLPSASVPAPVAK